MTEPWGYVLTAITTLITGGAGLELVRGWLGRGAARRAAEAQRIEAARVDKQQDFNQEAALRQQAEELREEMRRDKVELRAEVNGLRSEVDAWRGAYFELYHFLVDVHQRHTIVLTYVNAVLLWSKERSFDIPIPAPSLNPLPGIPMPPMFASRREPTKGGD